MDLAKIKKLLAIVAESEVAEVEIEEEGLKVVVRKSPPTVVMQQPPAYPTYHLGYMSAPPANATGTETATFEHAPPAGFQPVAPESGNAVPQAEPPEGDVIRAPIVGTFYRSPSPDSDPFVHVGDRVQPGDVLCIIEAMKLMNEIECETSGVVRKILVENAEPVEYDQPLFVIESE